MTISSEPTTARGAEGGVEELERFLAAHPNVEAVEYLITDSNGVLRGKWGPVESLKKAFTTGVNFPVSMFGLDVWGREVMETGLHVETGDSDGICTVVPGSPPCASCPGPRGRRRRCC